jgi:dTDP-4-dehydrorhamnose reductase
LSRLLVTGSLGQLGRAVLSAAEQRGLETEGHDLDTLDITDSAAVDDMVSRVRPGVVVNCAAFTAVDQCEKDEATATAVNGTAVEHLARACNRQGALLVQISTDYVFPGNGDRPYREDDPTGPAGTYGRSKLLGEHAARHALQHLILRTAWLYGHGGRHFVAAILRQIQGGATTLRVIADQHGCPSFCDDVAAATLDLVSVGARGTVHVVNSGATTWHGFATEIVRRSGLSSEVTPVSTSEYPLPAPRPAYSILDTARLASLLGAPLPDWRDALGRYLEDPCGS